MTIVNDACVDRSTIELINRLQRAGELSIRDYAMVGNCTKEVDYFIEQGTVKTKLLNVRWVIDIKIPLSLLEEMR
ncbi:hypothetical protein [Pseudozobellia sp. WGM2]|uniref:hypothetical protein n=1 Tax=Pseudozobellia sp. WGM2 TaxID=2787625 RepID=UPI001AE03A08|nr:hypothetical protein [Pseudozobellia sp. WGM2]